MRIVYGFTGKGASSPFKSIDNNIIIVEFGAGDSIAESGL
jgi:hypothetical protein